MSVPRPTTPVTTATPPEAAAPKRGAPRAHPGAHALALAALAAAGLSLAAAGAAALAGDWPEWGGGPSKNMVSKETGIPLDFETGRLRDDDEDAIDPATTKHVRWIAKLGSQAYGNPTIAGGRVYVGTNNETPRDPKYKGDRAAVYSLDEKTGDLVWQLNLPKLGAGKVSDWEFLGICSSPTVDGDRIYVVTNLCQVICLDREGLANGNDGMTGEPALLGGPGQPPIELGPKDADVLWVFDMRDELGVFPHNVTSSSVLAVGDRLYVTTSNGVDWSHTNIPSPNAPCLIVLDKKTGQLVGEESSGISKRLFHCNWASPAYGKVGDQAMVLFGAGDGFVYAFDPVPAKPAGEEDDEEAPAVLRELWRADANPPSYRKNGNIPIRYATAPGPSEIIASPVFHDGKVYVAIGQDPEHGEGVGSLVCLDASKKGPQAYDQAVWSYRGIGRSISTVSIADGLLYVAEYQGILHCLDANTGAVQWTQDTGAHIWGSTLVAEGRVYLGNEDGILTIMAHGREKKLLREVELEGPVYSSPVIANGVLYVGTQTHLYAIGGEP